MGIDVGQGWREVGRLVGLMLVGGCGGKAGQARSRVRGRQEGEMEKLEKI